MLALLRFQSRRTMRVHSPIARSFRAPEDPLPPPAPCCENMVPAWLAGKSIAGPRAGQSGCAARRLKRLQAAPSGSSVRPDFAKEHLPMKIAILPGDGIGPEIVAEATWSGCPRPANRNGLRAGRRVAYAAHGHPLPEATLQQARGRCRAVRCRGRLALRPAGRHLRPEQAILGLRRDWACSPISGRRSAIRSWPGPPASSPSWSPASIS